MRLRRSTESVAPAKAGPLRNFAKSLVIPAKAGIPLLLPVQPIRRKLDSRFRGNDNQLCKGPAKAGAHVCISPGDNSCGESDRPLPSQGRRAGAGSWLAKALILLARLWQWGPSVMLPPSCRYTPSCSSYAITALSRYGAAKGSWLAARRFLRCHPWGGSGVDPVP